MSVAWPRADAPPADAIRAVAASARIFFIVGSLGLEVEPRRLCRRGNRAPARGTTRPCAFGETPKPALTAAERWTARPHGWNSPRAIVGCAAPRDHDADMPGRVLMKTTMLLALLAGA